MDAHFFMAHRYIIKKCLLRARTIGDTIDITNKNARNAPKHKRCGEPDFVNIRKQSINTRFYKQAVL